jgi:type VII secretion-associated serine protease mycosin
MNRCLDTFLLVVVSLAAGVGPAAHSAAGAADRDGPIPTLVGADRDPATALVRFRPGIPAYEQRLVAASIDASVAERIHGTDYVLLRTEADADADVVRALEDDSRVVDAELNYVRRASAVPNDPEYPRQQRYLEGLRLPQAWDVAGPAREIRVAVVDTGVDAAHPDLAGRVLPGHDFANDDSDAYDDQWHGTWVAAIIAANTNNAVGIAGVSASARILPVKVLDAHGNGTDADVAAGITWAADHGADVINLSLGGFPDNAAIRQAVEYALERDVVVVAAAGNQAAETPQYPAAYPGVVAVAATDANGEIARFSGHGLWIDIAAPGVDITSARSRSSYETMSGTSYAAPFVSGVATLVQSLYPVATASEIVSQLLWTARDAGPVGVDSHYGHGLLDALAAVGPLRTVPAVAPPLPSQPTLSQPPPNAVTDAPPPAVAPTPDPSAGTPAAPASPPVALDVTEDAQLPQIALAIRTRRIPVSKAGAARISLECSTPPSCRGRVTLRTTARILGRARFSLEPGLADVITVRLSPSARRRLASRRAFIARAVATSMSGRVTASRLVFLELSKKT